MILKVATLQDNELLVRAIDPNQKEDQVQLNDIDAKEMSCNKV